MDWPPHGKLWQRVSWAVETSWSCLDSKGSTPSSFLLLPPETPLVKCWLTKISSQQGETRGKGGILFADILQKIVLYWWRGDQIIQVVLEIRQVLRSNYVFHFALVIESFSMLKKYDCLRYFVDTKQIEILITSVSNFTK